MTGQRTTPGRRPALVLPARRHPVPPWLRPLEAAARDDDPTGPMATALQRGRLASADPGVEGRRAAVLALFGEGPWGPDVLLIERAPWLRRHAGQPAFPGGGIEPGETDPAATALAEAAEETGLDPRGVEIFGVLSPLILAASDSVVTPVLGWWRAPCEVFAADRQEIAAVARVPLADLTDPANRGSWVHPSGFGGPAFAVAGLVVWGFTATVLTALLDAGGFTRPWDPQRAIELPSGQVPSSPITVEP